MSELVKTGFFAKKPHERAPGFVKASVSVKVDEAIAFLQSNTNSKGYVNFELNESKEGNYYLRHNDYEPNSAP